MASYLVTTSYIDHGIEKKAIISDNQEITQSSKKSILIVDDRQSTIDSFKPYFENQGYNVLQARTLNHAKSIIQKTNLNMILTDLDLTTSYTNPLTHRKDGYKLVTWLNAQQKQGNHKNIEEVILHSSAFSKGNIETKLMGPYIDHLRSKVGNIGYTTQPKTVLRSQIN